jgi:hypothetical protein
MARARIFMIVHSDGRRRFKPRIWLGRLLIGLGFRIAGLRGEIVRDPLRS